LIEDAAMVGDAINNQESTACWRVVAWGGAGAEVFAEFAELEHAVDFLKERGRKGDDCFFISRASKTSVLPDIAA
jgi:hypothetical protein